MSDPLPASGRPVSESRHKNMNLNRATLIGHLTKDPDYKELPTGGKLAVFSVATNRSFTDPTTKTKKESVQFHQVLAWGRLAELADRFLKKGRQVYVEGRLQTKQWEDENKKKHYRTEIVAENMIFLDKNSKVLTSPEELKPEEIAIQEVPFAA